jgi:hypothetical protein
MRIKTPNANELIVEVKSISWLGVVGTLLIWAGLIYGLIVQPIALNGKVDPFGIFFCLCLSLFCLVGLATSLSIEIWHFKRLAGHCIQSNKLLFSQKTNKYPLKEIQKIEFEKYVPNHDDVGGVKWFVYSRLTTGKRVEICSYQQAEYARRVAHAIKDFLNL